MTNGDMAPSPDDDRQVAELSVRPLELDGPDPEAAGIGGLVGADFDDPPPARPGSRRHIGRYVLAAAGLVVLVAAVLTGPTLWHVYAARNTTLELPEHLAGLSRDTSDSSQETADYLRDAIGTSTSLTDPVGAVYDLDGDKTHSVLIFGGTGSVYRPAHTLSSVFGLLDDSVDGVSGLHDVPAGPLGGVLKCGVSMGADDGSGTDPDITICGWADHGSVVAALFPGRTADEAAGMMRQIRDAIEKR